MQRMKKKNYPYYETTVFHDFREMTVNVAKKYPDRVAISYKNKPSFCFAQNGGLTFFLSFIILE